MATIDEIFREVESGACDFGVVPVENSTEGVVSHTLDLFMNSPLMITGEVSLRVHQHLLTKAADLAASGGSIRTSSRWRSVANGSIVICPPPSGCRSAAMPRRRVWWPQIPEAAAVAGLQAAEIYGLSVLAERIEDEPSNTTRFLVIGKQDSPPSGQDKTSLLLSCKNQSGGCTRCWRRWPCTASA
jgi:chorismate mutase / prephenate dehydratase